VYLYYFLAAISCWFSLQSLLSGIRYAAYVQRETSRPLPDFQPFVSVIVPGRGLEPGLIDNLRTLLTQVYPHYEVLFVFDAPDEQTAKQLIDQVQYEQVVQWLGENPNILKEAQRRYVNTTLGVLIAVLKASGYAAVLCLGIGGLIGGLLFSYRRSQQKAATAFSDAGGMLRLNLDELSAEADPGRLLRERN